MDPSATSSPRNLLNPYLSDTNGMVAEAQQQLYRSSLLVNSDMILFCGMPKLLKVVVLMNRRPLHFW